MTVRRLFAIAAVLAVAACARAPAPVHFFAEGQPQSLADWHVVDVRDGRLVPNDGVLPYDLATPLFTDYAHKLRTVCGASTFPSAPSSARRSTTPCLKQDGARAIPSCAAAMPVSTRAASNLRRCA